MKIDQKIQTQVELADYTTFQIGGPAKYFVIVNDSQELKQAIAWAKDKNEKIYWLGGGSNVLVSDQGVDGLVIKLGHQKLIARGKTIVAGAGALLANAVRLAKEKNLTGLEWAIGIPGTVGGATRGNAGAYGSCLADALVKVKTYDLKQNKFVQLDKDACQFSYRDSLFKHQPDLIVWEVTLVLSKSLPAKIKALMDQYWQSRLQAQPRFPSAGCIFKNLPVEQWPNKTIIAQAEREGKVRGGKLACGYLIDLIGIKGKQIGGARVALEHGNYIVNYNYQAKATEVKALIEEIKQSVKQRFGIDLEMEVQLFGF